MLQIQTVDTYNILLFMTLAWFRLINEITVVEN